jgi:hypothetical protein
MRLSAQQLSNYSLPLFSRTLFWNKENPQSAARSSCDGDAGGKWSRHPADAYRVLIILIAAALFWRTQHTRRRASSQSQQTPEASETQSTKSILAKTTGMHSVSPVVTFIFSNHGFIILPGKLFLIKTQMVFCWPDTFSVYGLPVIIGDKINKAKASSHLEILILKLNWVFLATKIGIPLVGSTWVQGVGVPADSGALSCHNILVMNALFIQTLIWRMNRAACVQPKTHEKFFNVNSVLLLFSQRSAARPSAAWAPCHASIFRMLLF